MKIYISGKMTGATDLNRPKFESAEALIRAHGHEPVNPHKLVHDHDQSYEEFMRVDIEALKKCDAIFLLDDWKESPGALREVTEALEMKIIFFQKFSFLYATKWLPELNHQHIQKSKP